MQAVWDRAVQRLAGYRQKEVYVHPAAGDAGLAAGAALYVYYQVLWHPTDLLRKLVDRGAPVRCSLITAGWLEIDTLEDYEATRTFEFD